MADKGTIYLYTDGSTDRDRTFGGWAFSLCKEEHGELIHSDYGIVETVTNDKGVNIVEGTHNSAEVCSIVYGLYYIYANLRDVKNIIIYSDSQYATDPIYFDSIRMWKDSGWRTQAGKPLKNVAVWQDMDKILNLMNHRKIKVYARWVKGHKGNKNNELMDKLAKRAVKERRINKLYE